MPADRSWVNCSACGAKYLEGNLAIHEGTTRHIETTRRLREERDVLPTQCAVCGGSFLFGAALIHAQGERHQLAARIGRWPTDEMVRVAVEDGMEAGVANVLVGIRELPGVKSNSRPVTGYRISDDELDRRFRTHEASEDDLMHMGMVRDMARRFAHQIRNASGPSREQSNALTRLEEVVYWANRAIVAEDR